MVLLYMKESDDLADQKKTLQKSTVTFPVVGVGASAGGLKAFGKLVSAIPKNSGMAYVLVQHMSPDHESLLPALLQKETSLKVLEITDNVKLEVDHIYIIPSNKILIATDGVLKLNPWPEYIPGNTNKAQNILRNMPIDLFFESLAEVHQANAVGVVLSGTAHDGTRGLQCIKEAGGITFAQDEKSAEFEGMPQSAIFAGVVDFILPPQEIPQKILQLTSIINGNTDADVNSKPKDEEAFREILTLLRLRKNTDFTYYKQSTIRRRIFRRMALNKIRDIQAFVEYLKENKNEQDVLYQDLLIPVSSFFRDPMVFDTLCETVFPHIVKHKPATETIRIWVAGCSTGQEAYSIAICLREFLDHAPQKVQIFATDISIPAIETARAGIYKKTDLEGISPERIKKFFTKINGEYQVKKVIREMCVFAAHNFLKDPPFSKMDLISCRNVFIYMEPYLQKKAISTFHYGLNNHGFLVLGKSETTSPAVGLFDTLRIKKGQYEKIFTRKDQLSKPQTTQDYTVAYPSTTITPNIAVERLSTDFQKTADEILLKRFTPAGVVINEAMDIVHFRGNTSDYLEQAPGKPSHNLLKMAREGLGFELRNIIHKLKNSPPGQKNKTEKKENICLKVNGKLVTVTIQAMLLPGTIEPHYLILFEEENKDYNRSDLFLQNDEKGGNHPPLEKDEQENRIHQLESEQEPGREDMRRITEDQEAANEELQSANEELLSSSEELQSLNEELETGKEELQSTNEELVMVNQEMLALNNDLTQALHYAEAIVATMREPLLILDKDLNIKSANNNFYKTFRVNELETEGRNIFELSNKQWEIPELKELLENILPEKTSVKDLEVQGNFTNLGQRIMILNANEIINKSTSEKLILLAIEDVTERRQLEEKEKELNEIFMNMVVQAPVIMVVLRGPNHVVDIINGPALKLLGKKREALVNKSLMESLPQIKENGYYKILDKVYETGEQYVATEQETIFFRHGKEEKLYLNFVYDPFRDTNGRITGIVAICNDVTAQVLARKKIEENEHKFHLIADFMPEKVWTGDENGNIDFFNKRMLTFTGLRLDELQNWGWTSIIHPEDLPDNEIKWQESVSTGSDYEFMHRFKESNGEYKWHLSRAIALKDEAGKVVMWVGTSTEIHSVKEEEERRANFIKMVSHELKTPVTSIKGYVQLLQILVLENTEIDFPEPVTTSLKRIDTLVNRLTRLITGMLDLSRLDSGELDLHLEEFYIETLVNEVVKDFKQINKKHFIVLENECNCKVKGDKNQIEQVMVNLLSNAIKYSDEGKEIKVRIYRIKNETVAVSITDEGIGINKKDQEKIFERFYRVSGKDEQTYPGFGIGLFISQSIITRHGGTLNVESEKNKGSIFTFTLPEIK